MEAVSNSVFSSDFFEKSIFSDDKKGGWQNTFYKYSREFSLKWFKLEDNPAYLLHKSQRLLSAPPKINDNP